MRLSLIPGLAILAGLLGSAAVIGEEPSAANAFMKCARIAGDAQRLLCYDRLAMELIELGVSTRGGLADTTGGSPAATTDATTPAATAAVPEPAASSSRTPAPTPSPVQAATPSQTATAVAEPMQSADAPPAQTVAASQAPAPPQTTAEASPPPAASPPEAAPTTATSESADAESSADDFGIETIDTAIARNMDRIETRYVGSFDGWNGNTIFELENGQVWQQSQSGRLVYRAVNPKVVIKRGMLGGYYLSVDGVNRRVRVKRLK